MACRLSKAASAFSVARLVSWFSVNWNFRLPSLAGNKCPIGRPQVLARSLVGQALTFSTTEEVDGEDASERGEGAVLAGAALAAGVERSLGAGVLRAGAAERGVVLRLAADDRGA